MLDLQTTEHGYHECYTPYIVNSSTLFGTGQLPKFKDDMFWVTKGGQDDGADQDEHGNTVASEDLYLISTSEITLAGSMRETITPQHDLPLKLTAHRSEERRVGNAWVSTCRSRGSPQHEIKKPTEIITTLKN